jgi:hypothetical protein
VTASAPSRIRRRRIHRLKGKGQFGGFAVGDDPIGRYYTVGARYRL